MSKKKGDRFRDEVGKLLRAAGFVSVETEQHVQFKHVDISAIWTRQTIDGPIKYAIEAKDYAGTLPLDQCSLFTSQYGQLVSRGIVDRAWLISKGPISSDGQNQIRTANARNIDCITFSELQRRLIVIDSYLADLTKQYHDSGIKHYFIQPHLADDSALIPLVMHWLEDVGSNQLAIFGDYGQGKSTFAIHLAHALLEDSKKDPAKRSPIRK
jgi:hypothetical protein